MPYSGLLLHPQDTVDCLIVLGKSMRLPTVFDRVIYIMNPTAKNPSILIEQSNFNRLNSITAVSSTQSERSYDSSYQWINHRSAVLTHHSELVVDNSQ